jgi:hypothetical protein
MKRAAVMIGLFACLTVPVIAGELAGVALADHVSVEGKTLVLNGMGLRKAYGFAKVYVAGLYLENKSRNADEILGSDSARRIELRFVRNVGRKDITKAWTEGFEKNAGASLPALESRIETLNQAMPDLRDGDTLAFSAVPGKGVVVEVNGHSATTIPGSDFARALFAIWLGASPPNTALKEGLLGAR